MSMPLDLFGKTSIPRVVPDDMRRAIDELKRAKNKSDCLRRGYEILIGKYRGYRLKTYLRLGEVFGVDIDELWNKKDFLHCTNINFLMRILLIESGHFREDEVRIRWTLVWYISPHQYLQIKVDNSWVNVDIWGYTHGIKFGDYAHGFY